MDGESADGVNVPDPETFTVAPEGNVVSRESEPPQNITSSGERSYQAMAFSGGVDFPDSDFGVLVGGEEMTTIGCESEGFDGTGGGGIEGG